MEMNNTKINWILLILFCLLTVLFSILLVKVPSTGDKMNTLARVGYWLPLPPSRDSSTTGFIAKP